MVGVAKQIAGKLWRWLDRPREDDPVERAWQDFQQSWDWAHEPPSRDIFSAGFLAGQASRTAE